MSLQNSNTFELKIRLNPQLQLNSPQKLGIKNLISAILATEESIIKSQEQTKIKNPKTSILIWGKPTKTNFQKILNSKNIDDTQEIKNELKVLDFPQALPEKYKHYENF